MRMADVGECSAKGHGTIARERPKHAASGDIAADQSEQGGNEGEDEESQGAAAGSSGLAVNFSERICAAGGNGGKVVNGVEDCDGVKESGDEADACLGQNSFRNVDAWAARVSMSF